MDTTSLEAAQYQGSDSFYLLLVGALFGFIALAALVVYGIHWYHVYLDRRDGWGDYPGVDETGVFPIVVTVDSAVAAATKVHAGTIRVYRAGKHRLGEIARPYRLEEWVTT